MKFALNRYHVDFHLVRHLTPPIPRAIVETLPYGVPPEEMREIWTIEIDDLSSLLAEVVQLGVGIQVSESSWWSGRSVADPGQPLFGISVIDDPAYPIDPRDLEKIAEYEAETD